MIYTDRSAGEGAWAVLVSTGECRTLVATADTRDEANGLVERIIRALNKHHRPWGGSPPHGLRCLFRALMMRSTSPWAASRVCAVATGNG